MDLTTARSPEDVRVALDHPAVTKSELARRAGVHKNTLRGVELPTWSPNWKTLTALCKAADDIISEADEADEA